MNRTLTRTALLASLVIIATPASAQPAPGQTVTLVKLTPAQVDQGKTYQARLTYLRNASLPPGAGAQVVVTWDFLRGTQSLGRETRGATLAKNGLPNGLVASVPLSLAPYSNLTRVAWRAQAFTVQLGATGGAQLVALGPVDSGSIPVSAVSSILADFVKLEASETAGGFGTPPPYTTPPPPPGIHFAVTFKNRTATALAASDPTLGVQVRFAEVTAAGVGPYTTLTARLSATIAGGSTATEDLGQSLPRIYQRISVSAALVRLDPATGKVVGFLSTASPLVQVDPPVYFPPSAPPPP